MDVITIKYLHHSLVRPHLDYGYVVWDPYACKNVKSIEKVQAFACKMASSKCCNAGYYELLGLLDIPSLEQRRTQLKVGIIYKIFHELLF